MLDGGTAQTNDGLHRSDIFGTDLDAHVATCAVPDAVLFLKGGQSRLFGRGRLTGIRDEPCRLRERRRTEKAWRDFMRGAGRHAGPAHYAGIHRSEEHTSELQSPKDLVC